MAELIADPRYWKRRLRDAPPGERHQAIFKCPLDLWQSIEAKHREILARTIGDNDSVLDAGCGWGRLLTLMPETWHGYYLGVDLSPDFIELARQTHPFHSFEVGDLRKLDLNCTGMDWAVLISIRPMIRRNQGDEVWGQMELELRRVSKRRLYLEYDPDDDGAIE